MVLAGATAPSVNQTCTAMGNTGTGGWETGGWETGTVETTPSILATLTATMLETLMPGAHTPVDLACGPSNRLVILGW